MLTITLFVILVTIVLIKWSPIYTILYWKWKGVPYYIPLLGSLKILFKRNSSNVDLFKIISVKYPNHRYLGYNFSFQPAVIICDPELVKQMILIEKNNFFDRSDFFNSSADPYFKSNFWVTKATEAKELRQIYTPLFTSHKIKLMFDKNSNWAKEFANMLENKFKDDGIAEIEITQLYSRYLFDNFLRFLCNQEANSLHNENHKLHNLSRNCFDKTFFFKYLTNGQFPWIFKLFNIPVVSTEFTKAVYDLVKSEIDNRSENNIYKDDILQYFLDTREKRLKSGMINSIDEYNDETIASQISVFFIAGSSATLNTISFLTYELAMNPEIQQKLQKEIDEVTEKHKNNVISYDIIKNLKYFEMVFKETLRKWPVLFAFDRVCKEDYVIEPINKNEKPFVIKAGTKVFFPIISYHHNPKHYPEPDKFDPERFNAENEKNASKSYMPFSVGYRKCFGGPFTLLEIKCVVFYLLQKYTFVPVKRTEIRPVLRNSVTMKALNGIYLGIKKRF